MSQAKKPTNVTDKDTKRTIEKVIKLIEDRWGSYTDGLFDKVTHEPVRIFHGIGSMTPDDWECFKSELRELS